MSYTEARKLMQELLEGSTPCYPYAYMPHVRCTLDGFRCGARSVQANAISRGRCVRGRLVVIGTGGP